MCGLPSALGPGSVGSSTATPAATSRLFSHSGVWTVIADWLHLGKVLDMRSLGRRGPGLVATLACLAPGQLSLTSEAFGRIAAQSRTRASEPRHQATRFAGIAGTSSS